MPHTENGLIIEFDLGCSPLILGSLMGGNRHHMPTAYFALFILSALSGGLMPAVGMAVLGALDCAGTCNPRTPKRVNVSNLLKGIPTLPPARSPEGAPLRSAYTSGDRPEEKQTPVPGHAVRTEVIFDDDRFDADPVPGYRPADAPVPGYRPADAPAPGYRPADAPAPGYRPADAPAPGYRPADAPTPGTPAIVLPPSQGTSAWYLTEYPNPIDRVEAVLGRLKSDGADVMSLMDLPYIHCFGPSQSGKTTLALIVATLRLAEGTITEYATLDYAPAGAWSLISEGPEEYQTHLAKIADRVSSARDGSLLGFAYVIDEVTRAFSDGISPRAAIVPALTKGAKTRLRFITIGHADTVSAIDLNGLSELWGLQTHIEAIQDFSARGVASPAGRYTVTSPVPGGGTSTKEIKLPVWLGSDPIAWVQSCFPEVAGQATDRITPDPAFIPIAALPKKPSVTIDAIVTRIINSGYTGCSIVEIQKMRPTPFKSGTDAATIAKALNPYVTDGSIFIDLEDGRYRSSDLS